jgi:dihydrofolate reductase
MGKIIVSEFISLDGVTQAPGSPEEDTDGGFRHGGWSMKFFDPEVMGAAIGELSRQTDAVLQGRRTWQVMANAWPKRTNDDPVTDWMNSVQKYVVSDTLTDDDATAWRPTTIIRNANLIKEVSALRGQPGGYVNIMGSASVVRALLAADLVDEMALMIEPIVLGGGKTIYPDDGEARPFELTSATTTRTGVQVCRYQRSPAAPRSAYPEDRKIDQARRPDDPAR